MRIRFPLRPVVTGALLGVLGGVLPAGAAGRGSEPFDRPGPAAACYAWFEHVGALIDAHRVAQHALWSAIAQFGSAREACSRGDYATGVRLYETLALGRVRRPLR
jgi:hypothetical protein